MASDDEFLFLEPLPSMEDEPCLFCDKNDPPCDMLIQENVPGGSVALAHQKCFEAWLEGDD